MKKPLRNIFIALICLLALTVGAAFIDFGRNGGFGIALAIAITKGLLIALYFMHLKRDNRMMTAFAVAGVMWLAIFTVLTAADYTTRNHPPDLNYKGEPRYLQQADAK